MLKLSVLTLATVICDENIDLTISVLKNIDNDALPKILIPDGAFLAWDVW